MGKNPIDSRLKLCIDTFEKYYKELNGPVDIKPTEYSVNDYVNLRKVILEAGKKLEYDLTKLHLLYNGVNEDALDSLLKVIENSFSGLVAVSRLSMGCGMCLASRQITLDKINNIYVASVQFFEHFQLCYNKKSKALSPSMVGAVKDACLDLEKLPTSNKLAIQSQLFKHMVVFKDIIEEFTEMIEDNEEEDEDILDGFDLGIEEEFDIKLTKEQKQLVTIGLHAVTSIGKYYQQTVRIVTKQPALIPPEQIEAFDKFIDECDQLADDVNEFAVCFYEGCQREDTLNKMKICDDIINNINISIKSFCDEQSDLYEPIRNYSLNIHNTFEELKLNMKQ
ncbi:hypothetical protein WA158_007931 [Blastocystis sp. Blastoise]